MALLPDVSFSYGPMLIGVCINLILYGVFLGQVAYLLVLESLNTGFDMQMMYQPLILQYGQVLDYFPTSHSAFTWSNVGADATGAIVAEPFLEKVCWKLMLIFFFPPPGTSSACSARRSIRVNLDLHTAPGSQNARRLNGVMGIANAQCMLDYIRIITEINSQPEWSDIVLIFEIINEALLTTIGRPQLSSFYLEARNMIRSITGYGAGNGPFVSIHDGFDNVSSWAGFLAGSDRIMLDTHPYFAFDQQPNDAPIATGTGLQAGGIWPGQACNAWGALNQYEMRTHDVPFPLIIIRPHHDIDHTTICTLVHPRGTLPSSPSPRVPHHPIHTLTGSHKLH
ncbi:glycoside hydrolase superfamily [Mycena galopus ATCC 62051]|nr:glycoside hydrolase superfamily [Mycena galopus ATCC 62051]